MPRIIEGPPEEGDARRPLGKKLLWFVALWFVGLISVAALAYGLRALIL
ncbi:MAG: hypothetical protein R3C30_15105 [Hyphomonadaceae bacterium]